MDLFGPSAGADTRVPRVAVPGGAENDGAQYVDDESGLVDLFVAPGGGPPPLPSGLIPRAPLVARLRATTDRVVAVLAPAGYGKTSLLTEWAADDERPFAWVALDDRDNDPSTLLAHIARELDQARPWEAPISPAFEQPRISVRATALPLLARSFSASLKPFVLVFDDIHLIGNVEAIDSITSLTGHLPRGSVVALSGRGDPGLHLSRIRVRGLLEEVGHTDLAMDRHEAALLLREVAGQHLDDAVVETLVHRTEGWPVALYLAGLALASEPTGALPYEGPEGDHRYVREYVRTEILARLPEAERRFLTRTAVLPTMCASLCDAVLRDTGSQRVLESIERTNHLLVPLDRRHRWFRCHDLFREALEAELIADEPNLVNQLRQSAIEWFTAHDQPERAFEQAMAKGDLDQARHLLGEVVLPVFHAGRISTLVAWIDRFGDRLAERDQTLATVSAWAGMVTGDAPRAERWAAAAKHEHERTRLEAEPPPAVPYYPFRAHLAHDGAAAMLEDARRGLDEVPEFNPWRGPALLIHGISLLLNGDEVAAEASFESACEVGTNSGALMAATMALAWRSLLAMSRDQWATAEHFSSRSRELIEGAHLEEYPFSAITFAVTARAAAHRGDPTAARAELVRTQRLLPLLTRAMPWIAIQTRVELARASLTLGDVASCRILLLEIDEILRRVPDLGRLVDEVAEVRARVDKVGGRSDQSVSSLTTAELRLIPYLSTHLSFREIGQRLFLSENTVKTHAGSIYRKLGVSSRSAAVECVEDLGLVSR